MKRRAKKRLAETSSVVHFCANIKLAIYFGASVVVAFIECSNAEYFIESSRMENYRRIKVALGVQRKEEIDKMHYLFFSSSFVNRRVISAIENIFVFETNFHQANQRLCFSAAQNSGIKRTTAKRRIGKRFGWHNIYENDFCAVKTKRNISRWKCDEILEFAAGKIELRTRHDWKMSASSERWQRRRRK